MAMNKIIELPTLKCLRCRHEWIPNRPVEPKVCPKCKSPYWNKPKWKGVWKFALGDRVVANQKAPGDYQGLCGAIVERGPGKVEYGVKLDGQGETIYLDSRWLDKLP
jgi:hypothetical protein